MEWGVSYKLSINRGGFLVSNMNELLKEKLQEFEERICKFLDEYIEITHIPSSHDIGLVGFSDYEWGELSLKGKQIQTSIYKELNIFIELLEVILRDQPDKYLSQFDDAIEDIVLALLQNNQVWESNIGSVIENVKKNFKDIADVINNQYYDDGKRNIIVPDTNALLTNPNIEDWKFDKIKEFELILLPTVLQELDKLKINHRNQDLRDKATTLIKKIKEYRHRGKLTSGVKLRGNNIIRAVAVEPKMDKTLSWLDPLNNDDRIVASFIEVCRENISASVILITSDINVQNKAEFSLLPFEEPPEK